jgi:N-acetylmuramoyl-L-alanine amidase
MALAIVSRSDCGLQPPIRPLSPMPASTVVGIVAHYVGADQNPTPTPDQTKALWRQLQAGAFSGSNGESYIDIPYNFALDPAGLILEGRGWGFQNAANGDSFANGHTWAICYLAGPGNPITDAAKKSLTEFSQYAATLGPVSYIKPHSSFYPTACPGDSVRNFLPTINLHPAPIPVTPKGQHMIIPAPVRAGDDPNRPECVALDAANKQLRLMNGAKVLPASTTIPSNSDIIDWYPTATGFTVIAKPIDQTGTFPAFHFTWAE